MELELSNYWDDFEIRVKETIEALNKGTFPSLQRLTVHLTESCNMSCEYCNMKFDAKNMPTEMVYKIIDDFIDMKGRIIHFTGGEPTIHKDYETICAYAKTKGLVVSSNTNALKKVDSTNIDKFKASFDTPYEDEFDKLVGKKSFNQVVQNMKEYSKEFKGKMISITAVLNKQTYRNMLELAKFVEENFDVYNLYYSNYKGNDPKYAFSDEEIDDMFENYIPKVLEFFQATGNTYSYRQLKQYHKYDFANTEERFELNKTQPCTIQLSEMTIDVDGNVHNCSHLYRDFVKPNILLNVNDLSVGECFKQLKENLNGCYTFLDKKCLSGCNTNLMGFNYQVQKQLQSSKE